MTSLAGLALGFLLGAGPSREPLLERAKAEYRALEFERCVATLERAARRQQPPEVLTEMALYGGLCRFNAGDTPGAVEQLTLALRLDPDLQLPPHSGPKVTEVFRGLAQGMEKQRVREPAAPPQTSPSLPAAPRVAAVEPVGRPSVLPYVLGGVAGLAIAEVAFFGLRTRALERQARDEPYWDLADKRVGEARQSATLANVGLVVGSAALTGLAIHLWLEHGRAREPSR